MHKEYLFQPTTCVENNGARWRESARDDRLLRAHRSRVGISSTAGIGSDRTCRGRGGIGDVGGGRSREEERESRARGYGIRIGEEFPQITSTRYSHLSCRRGRAIRV